MTEVDVCTKENEEIDVNGDVRGVKRHRSPSDVDAVKKLKFYEDFGLIEIIYSQDFLPRQIVFYIISAARIKCNVDDDEIVILDDNESSPSKSSGRNTP
ncbi:unnamed protein product, partial [Strongylus vulgaris]